MSQPTPGFEFPVEAQATIDAKLRDLVSSGGDGRHRPRIASVRPPRNTESSIVTPSMVPSEPVKPAAKPNMAPINESQATPRSEPEGISIDLPSRFHYYGFKDLYVKAFRVPHLGKVAKSHETGSMQILAEVVSSVLSTNTGDKDIAFKLSIADFNSVLYWLRLNSFSKKQMRVTWECTNPSHVHAVKEGNREAKSLQNSSIYTSSDITHTYLEEVPDPDYYHIEVEGYGRVDFRPETVMDVIDFMDSPEWEDPEFQYQARIASVLSMHHPDGTEYRLKERLAILEELPADAAALAQEFADIVGNFGVVEEVQTKCNGCGASTKLKIAVDAPSFLSPAF